MHFSLAVARNELRVLRRDPFPLGLLFVVPVVLMALFRPVLRLSLLVQGYSESNGSEQAVPGVAVLFSFFLVGLVGLAFFREHGWRTWDRLRASRASTGEVVVGKVLPLVAVAGVQLAWLFGIGWVFLGLRIRGSNVALALVCLAVAVCPVALGMALVSVLRTVQQVNVAANVGTVVIAAFGGALAPPWLLPEWARVVAPATPVYWAMRGFRMVILDGAGVGDALIPVGVLFAFTAGFVLLAALRFGAEETKVSWA